MAAVADVRRESQYRALTNSRYCRFHHLNLAQPALEPKSRPKPEDPCAKSSRPSFGLFDMELTCSLPAAELLGGRVGVVSL